MRRKSKAPLGIMGFFAVAIGGVLFVNSSSMFERTPPTIDLETNGYWNLKKPLLLKMNDTSGIVSYRVSLKTSGGISSLNSEKFITPEKKVSLEIQPPRSAYVLKDKVISIIVEATDGSKWNFFHGNSVKREYKLIIDRKRPQVSIVANSYKISRGGSAVVIFKAEDNNMKNLYIHTSFGKDFKVVPFYKEGYYISLLAWPVPESDFRATVIAKDKAGNSARTYIPLYLKEKYYRTSKITLTDKFLKGKIAQLAEDFIQTQGVTNPLKRFKIINEDVRAENEKLIHTVTSKVPDEMVSDFRINRMYPLRNAKVVAYFGDHRKYYYDGSFISEAYHVGLDMASYSMAKIKPQNSGTVVFADYNGLYGNMPIIYHGLGLYTLYGHCSSIAVNVGDHIRPNQLIAHTGKTGYAMGDHLHFGVLVQGIEVRPQEWMDRKWIKTNITNIIKKAKKIIKRSES
ncbi:Peptidase, M23/M37 family [hydrothermal vent metagenome]|uniref:Peptidase, M23/M37 family n=1 Tax=hydrothermal vent metagenome TaxID=652676 RepID=A0A1W1D2Z1_9ZZZZ